MCSTNSVNGCIRYVSVCAHHSCSSGDVFLLVVCVCLLLCIYKFSFFLNCNTLDNKYYSVHRPSNTRSAAVLNMYCRPQYFPICWTNTTWAGWGGWQYVLGQAICIAWEGANGVLPFHYSARHDMQFMLGKQFVGLNQVQFVPFLQHMDRISIQYTWPGEWVDETFAQYVLG